MTTMRIETDKDGTLKVKLGKGEWAAFASVVIGASALLVNQHQQLSSVSTQLADQARRLERIEQLYFTRKEAP